VIAHPSPWLDAEVLRPIDVAIADFFAQSVAPLYRPIVWAAAAQLSHALGQGDTCVTLNNDTLYFWQTRDHALPSTIIPPPSSWPESLLASGIAGDITATTPFVWLDNKLSFRKYFACEQRIALRLENFLAKSDITDIQLHQLWSHISNTATTPTPNWQDIAVVLAARYQLAIICGGPGTGKTTTITNLLSQLVQLAHRHGSRIPRIRLAAPTGKAATRMSESINHSLTRLPESHAQALLAALPNAPTTLHRLLGYRPTCGEFKYHRQHRLSLDILVLDEASMIDIELMAQLLEALPDHAKLILLGDRYQLPSVGIGAVFNDITCLAQNQYSTETLAALQAATPLAASLTANNTQSAITNRVCELQQSHRFTATGGIYRAAQAVKQGDINALTTLLKETDLSNELHHHTSEKIVGLYQSALDNYYSFTNDAASAEIDDARIHELFKNFSNFRILCALRDGEYGVQAINETIEHQLKRRLNLPPNRIWYTGRPIAITQNNYPLDLYNGDLGITLHDPATQALRVFFPRGHSMVSYAPTRLPAHEPAYAMTVHKSQGSEFARVALVLPPTPQRVLTRELLFTGITRAKQQLELFADLPVLAHALKQRAQRNTLLAAMLNAEL
jgi:exodeoxyribonuclease V alpha subunit